MCTPQSYQVMQQYFGAYTEKFLAQSAYTPKTFPRKRRTSLLLSLTHYLQGPTSRLMGAYGGLWGLMGSGLTFHT